MPDYTIADQLDFTHDAEGVTVHIWFPGERHLRMTWEQWDAMCGEVAKGRAPTGHQIEVTVSGDKGGKKK